MRFTRRRFLLSLGAVGSAAVATDAFVIEPNRITITHHALGTGTEPNAKNIRIVQWSDLHLRRVEGHVEQIAEETNRLKPDVLVITGDTLDQKHRLEELDEVLSLIGQETPKFSILGNWEYNSLVKLPDLAKVYAAHNCRLLVNETAEHLAGNSRLLLTGLDDLMGGNPNLDRALAGVKPARNHLLLMHCPGYRDMLPGAPTRPRATGVLENSTALPAGPDARPAEVAAQPSGQAIDLTRHRIDYMLSGHTHGGQITFFGAAPITPWGSGRYVSGWYRERGPALYVSRGLGTTAIPARFCSAPEIAVFDWTLDES